MSPHVQARLSSCRVSLCFVGVALACLATSCGDSCDVGCYTGPQLNFVDESGQPILMTQASTLELVLTDSDGVVTRCDIAPAFELEQVLDTCRHGIFFNGANILVNTRDGTQMLVKSVSITVDSQDWSAQHDFPSLRYKVADCCRFAPTEVVLTRKTDPSSSGADTP